jgi:hypothetical protein
VTSPRHGRGRIRFESGRRADGWESAAAPRLFRGRVPDAPAGEAAVSVVGPHFLDPVVDAIITTTRPSGDLAARWGFWPRIVVCQRGGSRGGRPPSSSLCAVDLVVCWSHWQPNSGDLVGCDGREAKVIPVFLRLAPSPPSLLRRPGGPTCRVGTVRRAPAPHCTHRNSSPAGSREPLVQAWPPGSAPFCVRF